MGCFISKESGYQDLTGPNSNSDYISNTTGDAPAISSPVPSVQDLSRPSVQPNLSCLSLAVY